MEKHTIRLHPLGKVLEVNNQTPLIDVLHEYGVEFPCGGRGTCGKCTIKLLEGEINTDEANQKAINKRGLSNDYRFACLSKCSSNITINIDQFNHLILADESEFNFVPQDGFGVAIDLGTTTVVAQLIDLTSARVLAVETMLNPQVKFGADQITRIQSCLDGCASEMCLIIRAAVGTLIELMLRKHEVEIRKVMLVGNSVMQLIFSNGDVSPLSMYPFHSDSIGMKTYDPKELGWDFHVSEQVKFLPCIESFVGSDILAGIVATNLYQKEKYSALIDLGTNGEIVVGNKNQIVCASTAAGPAFEGASIFMGMRAVTGAIASLTLINSKIDCSVIGNTEPKGICGSALIDAIAILRKLDLIGMFGEINSGETQVQIAGNVFLTQKDIQEFQLAKAAIAAGLKILITKLSIELNDIEKIYIAGGFGNYITIDNVISTGMLECEKDVIQKMGNTALLGAKMLLFSKPEILDEILLKTKHINLEGESDFQDIYVDKMIFP